jgi:hypothetical protein
LVDGAIVLLSPHLLAITNKSYAIEAAETNGSFFAIILTASLYDAFFMKAITPPVTTAF